MSCVTGGVGDSVDPGQMVGEDCCQQSGEETARTGEREGERGRERERGREGGRERDVEIVKLLRMKTFANFACCHHLSTHYR